MIIDGGSSPDTALVLSLIATGSVDAAVKLLDGTPYRFLSELPAGSAKGGISAYEKELDRYLLRKGLAQFLKDPLTIAPAIGYTRAKHAEVTNLRIIARGKSAGVPEKEIRGELLHV